MLVNKHHCISLEFRRKHVTSLRAQQPAFTFQNIACLRAVHSSPYQHDICNANDDYMTSNPNTTDFLKVKTELAPLHGFENINLPT